VGEGEGAGTGGEGGRGCGGEGTSSGGEGETSGGASEARELHESSAQEESTRRVTLVWRYISVAPTARVTLSSTAPVALQGMVRVSDQAMSLGPPSSVDARLGQSAAVGL